MAKLFTDPSDVQRAKTLADAVPLLKGLTSLLHVGEQLREGWEFWPDWFRSHGVETFDVLEIYGANVTKLRNLTCWRHIYKADLRHVKGLARAPVDVAFWWHGPEHVLHSEVRGAIEGIVDEFQPKLIILGIPWGVHVNTERDFENPAEYHISTWYPADFEGQGFTVRTDASPNTTAGHITAWKVVERP